MDGPGEYLPDVTDGVTRVEDLPQAKVARRSRTDKRRRCPECGHWAYRDRVVAMAVRLVVEDGLPYQVCEFHVIKELTKSVLRAVAKVRKELETTMPNKCGDLIPCLPVLLSFPITIFRLRADQLGQG